MSDRTSVEPNGGAGHRGPDGRGSSSQERPDHVGTNGGAVGSGVGRWLRWPAARLGRLVQWICPTGAEARKECCSDRCRLWVLCKCSQEEFRSSGSIEDRTWWLLAACGGAVILYWLLAT
jgi:hypothetical protein